MAKPGELVTDIYRSTRLHVARIETRIIRTPIAVPIRTSFGIMRDRPAVFLKVTDADGAEGFGEIWCNFPSVGAEHRARLADQVIGPLLIESGELELRGIFAHLMQRLHILAIQSGEWGPLGHVAAGIDAACHDLAARKAGLPLWRFLDGSGTGKVRAYASGIGPEAPAELAASAAGRGHTAFKLKVGFGSETDLRSLVAIRSILSSDSMLMADANQGWRFDDALKGIHLCADHGAVWIEEPIAADRPLTEWTALARNSSIALAGGENINRLSDFETVIAGKILRYLQPDVAKWGGVSGCLEAARLAQGAGMIYCPHFLGSGIGLMASAHLLAAAGGEGLLEIDVNPNPHRDALLGGALPLVLGSIQLSEAAGIGIEPDWRAL
jgi:L-alanine-DL-glutamate epimerase-like enolase superfamily enzyme